MTMTLFNTIVGFFTTIVSTIFQLIASIVVVGIMFYMVIFVVDLLWRIFHENSRNKFVKWAKNKFTKRGVK